MSACLWTWQLMDKAVGAPQSERGSVTRSNVTCQPNRRRFTPATASFAVLVRRRSKNKKLRNEPTENS